MDYMMISKMPKKTNAVAPQDYMTVSKAPPTAKAPTLRMVNASKEPTTVELSETAVSKKGTNKTAKTISEQDYMAVSKAPKKQKTEIPDYMAQAKMASAKPMDHMTQAKQLKQPAVAISGDSKQTSAKSAVTTTTTAKQSERKVTKVKSKKEKTTKEKTKKSSKTPREKALQVSSKEKTKKSVKEKEPVKVIVLTKIGDAKSNEDPNDKKQRKMPNFKSQRKSLIIKLSMIIVLIILLAAVITAVIMYMLITVTPSPMKDNTLTTPKHNITIQFMNDVCNRNVSKRRFKGCWYYEKKFVDDCVEVQCRFIGLTSHIVQEGNSYKLAFKQEKIYMKVKVPDGVPCKRDGRPDGDAGYCESGICQPRRDWKELGAYETQNETDGRWKKVETIFESCIKIIKLKNFNKKYLFDSAQYNEYANCPQIRSANQNHLCLNAAYEYRVCTLPTLGGKPCWNDENDLKLYEWPITVKKMCSNCIQPDPNLNHNCPERKCSIMFDDKSESPLQYVQMISFETCCELGPPEQCMMGRCTDVVEK